jgi:hypothetical protein
MKLARAIQPFVVIETLPPEGGRLRYLQHCVKFGIEHEYQQFRSVKHYLTSECTHILETAPIAKKLNER